MSVPLCQDCLFPVGGGDRFCPQCGAVVHVFAELDPMNILRAEAEMFRRGIQRPRWIILIGMWLLLLPVFLILLIPFLEQGRIVYRIPGLVLTVLYGMILFRLTRNFARKRQRFVQSPEE